MKLLEMILISIQDYQKINTIQIQINQKMINKLLNNGISIKVVNYNKLLIQHLNQIVLKFVFVNFRKKRKFQQNFGLKQLMIYFMMK